MSRSKDFAQNFSPVSPVQIAFPFFFINHQRQNFQKAHLAVRFARIFPSAPIASIYGYCSCQVFGNTGVPLNNNGHLKNCSFCNLIISKNFVSYHLQRYCIQPAHLLSQNEKGICLGLQTQFQWVFCLARRWTGLSFGRNIIVWIE